MYEVDTQDEVVQLTDVPQSSIGAPLPRVVADEDTTLLAYILQSSNPARAGKTKRAVTDDTDDESIAIVRFHRARAVMFGPPNDEAFKGHPLAARGLRPYAAFEIRQSSWIRQLERMNSVHPHHNSERFFSLRHFVFTFHDTTFECIADRFEIVAQMTASMSAAVAAAAAMLAKR